MDVVANWALHIAPAYSINRDELGRPPDFLKLNCRFLLAYTKFIFGYK